MLLGEEEILKTFLNNLQPDDVIWDVGASYGIYSLFVGKKFSSIKIYAFEPEPQTLKLLYKNLSLNRVNNVRPLKFALGNYNGTASLHMSITANI